MNICGADLTVRWNDRFRGSQRGLKRGEPGSLESLCARANELIDAISRSDIDEGMCGSNKPPSFDEVNVASFRTLGPASKRFGQLEVLVAGVPDSIAVVPIRRRSGAIRFPVCSPNRQRIAR